MAHAGVSAYNLNSGDHLAFNDIYGERGRFLDPLDFYEQYAPFQKNRVQGWLLGPEAEEVIGAFETADYLGAFGAKRR